MDPAKYRQQNEKITDTLRGMFEKATGKKVCFTREMWFKMAPDNLPNKRANAITGAVQVLELSDHYTSSKDEEARRCWKRKCDAGAVLVMNYGY